MLLEHTERNGKFLSIKHGAICLESKEPKEGYELIEGVTPSGEPYSKYIRKFKGVRGLIVKIEWYSREYNGDTFKGLHLTIKDGGERCILDLPFERRHYDYFTKIAENIDYSKPVTFETWPDTKNAKPGKPVPTAFVCIQDDKYVQWKYARGNMGDCPEPVQRASGKWNFDDQRDWLLDRMLKYVIPHVEELHAFSEPEDEYEDEKGDAYEPPRFAGSHSVQEPPEMPLYTGEEPAYVKEAAENATR